MRFLQKKIQPRHGFFYCCFVSVVFCKVEVFATIW